MTKKKSVEDLMNEYSQFSTGSLMHIGAYCKQCGKATFGYGSSKNLCDCVLDKNANVVKKVDPVNHPSHYTSSPATCSCGKAIECIDVVRHQNFNRGNAMKYLWRAGSKDDEVQDLRKAAWYLNDEITRLERERAKGK